MKLKNGEIVVGIPYFKPQKEQTAIEKKIEAEPKIEPKKEVCPKKDVVKRGRPKKK